VRAARLPRFPGMAAMNATVGRLLLSRLVTAVLTLWFVATAVFVITNLLPGDVAQELLGQAATPETVAGVRKALGLDVPPFQRYLVWLGNLVTGDAGRSLVNGQPVTTLIGSRLGNSLMLAGITALVAVPIALALGITAAVKRGSMLDRSIGAGTILAVSVPEFLVASAAVLIFAVHLQWVPALSRLGRIESFSDLLRTFALPVLTLTCVIVAQMARMTRAALVDVLSSSYVEMAKLKGASPARIVLYHALPNAIGPIANAIAFSLSFLLGGVIIVETIFNYPGIAKLMVDGVATRDLPLVQACAMLFCAGYLILVTIADIAAILANPRLVHG
jgi:peptide/nickel transport system permease protein